MKYWAPRIAIVLLLLVIGVLVIVFREDVSEGLQNFATWIQKHKVLGPVILLVAYIIATVAFIPGTILTLGAGWAF